jgi:hypothetical protein
MAMAIVMTMTAWTTAETVAKKSGRLSPSPLQSQDGGVAWCTVDEDGQLFFRRGAMMPAPGLRLHSRNCTVAVTTLRRAVVGGTTRHHASAIKL